MVGFKQAKQSRRHCAKISRPSVERLHFSACHDHYTFSDGRMVLTDRRVSADVQVLDVCAPPPSTPSPKRPCLDRLDEDSGCTSPGDVQSVDPLPRLDFISPPSPSTSASTSSPHHPPIAESSSSSTPHVNPDGVDASPSKPAEAQDGASTSGTQSNAPKRKVSSTLLPSKTIFHFV